jgi:septal ring factor EnvC (AmiA/AmiB activator)
MSQSFWEPETAEETQPEQPPKQEAADQGTVALSVDDFTALEDRILRAVNLVKRERLTRAAAEERAAQAEAQLQEQAPVIEHLQSELKALHDERDHVRQRVERLLSQLDALEL